MTKARLQILYSRLPCDDLAFGLQTVPSVGVVAVCDVFNISDTVQDRDIVTMEDK